MHPSRMGPIHESLGIPRGFDYTNVNADGNTCTDMQDG